MMSRPNASGWVAGFGPAPGKPVLFRRHWNRTKGRKGHLMLPCRPHSRLSLARTVHEAILLQTAARPKRRDKPAGYAQWWMTTGNAPRAWTGSWAASSGNPSATRAISAMVGDICAGGSQNTSAPSPIAGNSDSASGSKEASAYPGQLPLEP